MATTFILLRHGQTDWNLSHRYQGHIDNPLNIVGENQAREAGILLRNYSLDAVYCSDMDRARRTAALALEGIYPLEKIYYDRRLRERSFGIYEGGPYDPEFFPREYAEAMEQDPDNFRFPEGESLVDLGVRIRPFYEEMLEKYPGKTVLLVAHGSLLSILRMIILHKPVGARYRERLKNAEPVILQSTPAPNIERSILTHIEQQI